MLCYWPGKRVFFTWTLPLRPLLFSFVEFFAVCRHQRVHPASHHDIFFLPFVVDAAKISFFLMMVTLVTLGSTPKGPDAWVKHCTYPICTMWASIWPYVFTVQAVSDKERQQMGELLLRAAEDGSLEKALQSKAGLPSPGWEDLRSTCLLRHGQTEGPIECPFVPWYVHWRFRANGRWKQILPQVDSSGISAVCRQKMEKVPCVKLRCGFFSIVMSTFRKTSQQCGTVPGSCLCGWPALSGTFFSLFLMDGPVDTYMKVNDDNVGSWLL